MKITFLLPYASMNGGIRVVSIYAKLLLDRGHEVNVVSVMQEPLTFRKKLRRLVNKKKWSFEKPAQGHTYFDKNDSSWTVLNHSGPIVDDDLPDADVVVATWWKTAEWASQLDPKKGVRVYFCQGYEVHNTKYRERAEATYHLPMKMVCVSEWVRKQIRDLTGIYDQEIVPNGVDINQFYRPINIKRDSQCFGFVFSEEYIKGADIMIEALTLAKALKPEIRAVAFGSMPRSKAAELPAWVEFYESPPQDSIREIYSQCSAWLFGSRSEGFGLPILEAMACKTPVIATPAGAATDLVSDTCGYIVETSSPEEMCHRIVEFSEMNPIDWARKSESAFKMALNSDWNSSCSKLENILESEIS